jgi:hypothetical protein
MNPFPSDVEVIDSSPPWQTTPKDDYFFLPVETIKQIVSGEWVPGGSKSAPNSIVKYLCSHKHLNPLAVNRVKLVARRGLTTMQNFFSLSLSSDIGALEAYNKDTTLCTMCVLNCCNYLSCKDRLRNDSREVKNLLNEKYEFSDEKQWTDVENNSGNFDNEKITNMSIDSNGATKDHVKRIVNSLKI